MYSGYTHVADGGSLSARRGRQGYPVGAAEGRLVGVFFG